MSDTRAKLLRIIELVVNNLHVNGRRVVKAGDEFSIASPELIKACEEIESRIAELEAALREAANKLEIAAGYLHCADAAADIVDKFSQAAQKARETLKDE